MSFEVDGTVALVVMAVPLGILLYAVITIPRWCVRSVSKHALWRLRDDIVDDTISGSLPRDHVAVRELIGMTEWALNDGRSFDLLHLAVWVRACRNISERTHRELQKEVTLSGLTDKQSEQVKNYRARYVQVAIAAVLFSSWMGIAFMLRFLVPAAFAIWRGRDPRPVSVTAASAAANTRLGRYSREYVWAKPRDAAMASANLNPATAT